MSMFKTTISMNREVTTIEIFKQDGEFKTRFPGAKPNRVTYTHLYGAIDGVKARAKELGIHVDPIYVGEES